MKAILKTLFLSLIILVSCEPKAKKASDSLKPTPKETETSTTIATATSVANLKQNLTEKGYQIFDYVDEKTGDTVLMQQYFIAFLKRGENRSQSKEVSDSLQKLHLAHLGKMYEEGLADISGPFGDDGDIRGITIYNVPTIEIADSLANADPMVKAGRLKIEVHPWWAAKGFPLR